MNFFASIKELGYHGTLNITIHCDESPNLVVTLLPSSDKITDAAKHQIIPLTMEGTPEDFDNHFFDRIKTPIERAGQFFSNLEAFEKSLEKAQAASKMKKEQETSDKPKEDSNTKRYKTAMEKVAELEKQNKIGEAIAKLPKPADFPEQADEIEARAQELRAKRPDLSLF